MDSGRPSATAQGPVESPSALTAVRDLYERHYVALVRLATLLVRDLGAAEEIVQDAFVELVARWHTIREPGAAVGYLRTAVANRARSQLRHRAVVRRHPDNRPSDAHSAEAEALVHLEHERVLSVLSGLPGRQREVVILRYYGQLSEAEIADTLGISRGAVKSHNFRALRALRHVLEVTP